MRQTTTVERYRLPLAVLVVGLASIAVLIVADRIRHQRVVRDSALVKAIEEIQLDVAISHLWLEEHVSGDRVDTRQIVDRIDRSLTLVGVMLGEHAPSATGPSALEETALIRQAAELERQLEAFRRISDQRRRGFDNALDVGIGSAMDVDYDAVFDRVLREAQALELALETRARRHRDRSRVLFGGILTGWAALIIIAAGGLASRERSRRRAETALRESQDQLFQAQKLEAVGRVAGGLAHDINSYLAAIRGHCELVRRKRAADDPVGRKMDAVIRTVGKASTLIDRLLAFSQRQAVAPEVMDLNQVIAGLEKIIRPSLGEDVAVDQRLAEDLWPVLIDRSQIEQVIVNLLINARDAMPAGGTVTVTTANRPPGEVMLEVADTGDGIAPETLDKIFEPFWTTKEKASHSGMGLATVYGIVQQSGGRVGVTSELGRGSRFRIVLPRTKD